MHTSPRNSLASIEKQLQLIDEEFSSSAHGQGSQFNGSDDSDLFKEIGHALDLQNKRSEEMAEKLEEQFLEEENELNFPVHIGHAVGEDSDESLQTFIREMEERDITLKNFQGTLKDTLKYIERIRDITLRGSHNN